MNEAYAEDAITEGLSTQSVENGIRSEVEGQQQQRTVSGFVRDENGDGIPGVSVVVKGTVRGTITDLDGAYTIGISKDEILLFSFIGMATQEVAVGEKKTVNVVMKNTDMELEEISVVAYGTKKKVTITGAISSIGTEDLVKMPTASISNMLAGSVSGLASVQYSGQPGEDGANLYIRGIATLNSSSPLVLVDGVERGFTQIDPNEIADVTVLKDASSTAVFGVRGANGVILVTTRRGKVGAPKISLSSTFSIQAPTRLGEYVGARDYMLYINETDLNDGRSPSFSQEILDIYEDPNRNKLIYPDSDWQEMLYDNYAPQQQHNVNISGGSERVRYFASVGMFNQKGIFNGNKDLDYNGNFTYHRNNIRANLDIDVTKSTLVSVNIGGRIENRNEPQGFNDNFFNNIREGNPLSAGLVDGVLVVGNPHYMIIPGSGMDYYQRGVQNKTTNVLNLDLKVKQDLDFITKGLDLSLKGSYNSYYTYQKVRTTSRPSYTPWFRKDIPWLDAPASQEEGEEVILIKEGDYGEVKYTDSYGKGRDFYVEMAMNYKRSFGSHNVSGLLMYNASRKYYQSSYPDLPLGYVGMVGRATYDYSSKYLVDFSVGYNGSEKFHRKQRYGLFPSASIGWVVTEEGFLKDNSVISFLKLRASYGLVGADNIGRFLYLPDSYKFGGGYVFGGVAGGNNPGGAYEGSINNKDVTWETSEKQNYGVDMRFMGARLAVSADYFMEKRDDILINRNTFPTFVAYNPPAVNMGRVDNKGTELSIKWHDKINEFKYNIGVIGSFAKNTVVFRDEVPNPENPWTLATGHPLGQPFGYKFLGFYYDGMLNDQGVDAIETQPTLKEGDCVYADTNGDGAIDDNDRIAIGYPNYPLLTAGVTAGFEWKKLSFSMTWNGATKVSRVFEGVLREPLGPTGNRSLMQEQFDNRWTPETAETATLPRASVSSLAQNSQVSSLWIKDASYIRLKNIRVGYDINNALLKTIGVKNMNVFAVGYNLITLDKLGVLDPEIRTQGKPTYPLMKVYSLGVNVTF
uniref:SusC/RagA family TonB-linked outer membrane protein n=1 Tax=uncultured Draconibacterium sp. TaxID=1573823 RepID=UPI003216A903